ncbi:MAG: hypothetical protein KC731_19380, partial [Myxococcales bacterium]|nr:hypothetical protein [Myxococcales bacterium]
PPIPVAPNPTPPSNEPKLVSSPPTAPSTTPAPQPSPSPPEAIEGSGLECELPLGPPERSPLASLDGIQAVFGGEAFCVVDADGRLWCGHAARREAMFRHPVVTPKAVFVTEGAFCALDATSTLVCEIDLRSRVPDFPVDRCLLRVPDVEAAAVYSYPSARFAAQQRRFYLCYATRGGGVGCHRRLFESDSEPPLFTHLTPPITVGGVRAARELTLPMSCARGEDGGVSCWNGPPELGATNMHQLPPPQHTTSPDLTWMPGAKHVSGLSSVMSLQGGEHHACALDRRGTVKCWGQNEVRQLGFEMRLPPPSYDAAPALVDHPPRRVAGIGVATELAVGANHSCIRTVTGQVSCWGHNAHRQLGDARDDCHAQGHGGGMTMICAGPGIVPKLPAARQIAAMGDWTIALTENGTPRWLGEDDG